MLWNLPSNNVLWSLGAIATLLVIASLGVYNTSFEAERTSTTDDFLVLNGGDICSNFGHQSVDLALLILVLELLGI